MTEEFPAKSCDLIMKGGITSGVVYPKAITKIASEYRLKGIGGASAGAIGAVMAAAAEYRRQEAVSADLDTEKRQAGFDEIDKIPDDLGENLKEMFQPSEALAPLFRIFIAAVDAKAKAQKKQNKTWEALKAVIKEFFLIYWYAFAACWALVALFLFAVMSPQVDPNSALPLLQPATVIGWVIVVLTIGLIVPVLYGLYRIAVIVLIKLPKHHFGLCTGKTQPGAPMAKSKAEKVYGFADWIHLQIQKVAGRGAGDKPLLVGDLRKQDVTVATMTTDISSGRPYQLPIKTDIFWFCETEFSAIFHQDIMDQITKGQSAEDIENEYGLTRFFKLPIGDEFPVLLMARMSLSFPGLVSAVPLYRHDETLPRNTVTGKYPLKRCLFSDGGISSNFPIHFFDKPIPGHPTFGISLAGYDEKRSEGGKRPRVEMSSKRQTDKDLPVRDVSGVIGFLMSIINTAKDWQDTLQRLMPGYSERVVEVRLKSTEGGANLTMTKPTVEEVSGFGATAGKLAVTTFDFDDHRWKRVLTSLPEIEQAIGTFARTYEKPNQPTYENLLLQHEGTEEPPLSDEWRKEVLLPFAEALVALGKDQTRQPDGSFLGKVQKQDGIPHIDADFRLVASADRVPKARKPSNKGTGV